MRKLLLLVLASTVAFAVGSGAASASGPAAPGKDIIALDCEGTGPITISVQRAENSNGAGQIVDQKGHGIPVEITFTLTDVTTNTVIDSETTVHGGGHAHSNQTTSHCSGVAFDGLASDIFGTNLPPGVAATDAVQGTIDAEVIIKT
jgi:hypothetical protein